MKAWHIQLDSSRADHTISLRLLGFVLASLLAHSTLLLSQYSEMRFDATTISAMQITLGMLKTTESQPKSEPLQQSQPAPPTRAKASPPVVQQQRSQYETPSVKPKTNATAAKSALFEPEPPLAATLQGTTASETDATAAVSPDAQASAQQRITLNQMLNQALARHFHYPMLARKRGWQGVVRLAFTLDTNGTITHARIAQGSGYRALDRAALKSLHQVAGINKQLTQALSFELPVIYSLSGG